MKRRSHLHRIAGPLLVALAALALAGCSGGSLATGWPGLSADDQMAYVADNQAVYAINLQTGAEAWRYPAQAERSSTFFAAPAPTGEGHVIVGGYDNKVHSLISSRGIEAWTFNGAQGRIIGAPVVVDQFVLVPSGDGNLYALDLNSGREIWHFTSKEALWAAPLVSEGRVYTPGLDHKLYALNLQDGRVLWDQDLGGALADKPVLGDGIILAGTFGKGLQAVDPASGRVLWSWETNGWVWGNPALDGSRAFFGDVAGTLFAIDVSAQGPKAAWQLVPDGPMAATPALSGDLVIFGTENGTLYARHKADGTPAWEATLTGKLLTTPVMAGDSLLVASTGGEALVTAIDPQAGSVRWTFQPAK
jgi:outer membrane protein assembly factor BamB